MGEKTFQATNEAVSVIESMVKTSEDYDNIFEYKIQKNKTVSITRILSDGDVVIPEKIKGYTVTLVCGYSFKNIKSLTLPNTDIILDGIDYLEDHYYKQAETIIDNSYHLEKMIIPNENPYYCTDGYAIYSKDRERLLKFYSTNATHYSVPDGTIRICNGAFATSDVVEVNLPDSLKEIGCYAFESCKKLISITGGTHIETVQDNVVHESAIGQEPVVIIGKVLVKYNVYERIIRVPDGIEVIGKKAFEKCDIVEEILLPKSVRRIEEQAISNLRYLKRFILEDGNDHLSNIEGIIYNKNATELICIPYGLKISFCVIPSSVRRVDSHAIHNKYIKKLEFKGPVADFGELAIYGCRILEEIIFSDGQKNLSAPDNRHFITNCEMVSSIRFPRDIEIIGSNFCSYASVRELDIPDGIKEIGEMAFYNNPLKFVKLPKSLEQIGQSAFSGDVKRIILYDSLKGRKKKNEAIYDQYEKISSCYPLMCAGDRQKKGYEIVVLSTIDNSVKFRTYMPPSDSEEDFTVFSNAWKKGGIFSFIETDNYFPSMKSGQVHYALLRLCSNIPISKNREMMIRILQKATDADRRAFANEFKEIDSIIQNPEKGNNHSSLDGYAKADKSIFFKGKGYEITNTDQLVQVYFRGLKEEVEQLENLFSDCAYSYEIEKKYENGIVEGRLDISIVRTAILQFPALKITGMLETRRGTVVVFFSSSGYSYITDHKVVGYYDIKSDGRWDAECDLFGSCKDTIQYIQTGDTAKISYRYPYMKQWCNDEYYREIDGDFYEPESRKVLAIPI